LHDFLQIPSVRTFKRKANTCKSGVAMSGGAGSGRAMAMLGGASSKSGLAAAFEEPEFYPDSGGLERKNCAGWLCKNAAEAAYNSD
jgi:hypothetical protein